MLLQGNGNFSLDIRHDYDMQVEGKLLLQVLLGVTLLCTQQKTYFTRHFIHDKYPNMYIHLARMYRYWIVRQLFVVLQFDGPPVSKLVGRGSGVPKCKQCESIS